MAKYWYSYVNGAANTPTERIKVNNWNYVYKPFSNPPPPFPFVPCLSISKPCIIYATGAIGTPGLGTHPSALPGSFPPAISANLQSYLSTTIGFWNRYPISPGGKSYVYNKS